MKKNLLIMRIRSPKLELTSSSAIEEVLQKTLVKIDAIYGETSKAIKSRKAQRDKLIADYASIQRKEAKDDIAKIRQNGLEEEQGSVLSLLLFQLSELHQCQKFAESSRDGHRKLVPAIKSVLQHDEKIVKILSQKFYPSCAQKRDEILKTVKQYIEQYGEIWESMFEPGAVDTIEEMYMSTNYQPTVPAETKTIPFNPTENLQAV